MLPTYAQTTHGSWTVGRRSLVGMIIGLLVIASVALGIRQFGVVLNGKLLMSSHGGRTFESGCLRNYWLSVNAVRRIGNMRRMSKTEIQAATKRIRLYCGCVARGAVERGNVPLHNHSPRTWGAKTDQVYMSYVKWWQSEGGRATKAECESPARGGPLPSTRVQVSVEKMQRMLADYKRITDAAKASQKVKGGKGGKKTKDGKAKDGKGGKGGKGGKKIKDGKDGTKDVPAELVRPSKGGRLEKGLKPVKAVRPEKPEKPLKRPGKLDKKLREPGAKDKRTGKTLKDKERKPGKVGKAGKAGKADKRGSAAKDKR